MCFRISVVWWPMTLKPHEKWLWKEREACLSLTQYCFVPSVSVEIQPLVGKLLLEMKVSGAHCDGILPITALPSAHLFPQRPWSQQVLISLKVYFDD